MLQGEGPNLVTAGQGLIGGSLTDDGKIDAVEKLVKGDRATSPHFERVSGDIMKIGDVSVRVDTGTRKVQEEGRGNGRVRQAGSF